jgi:hypothetical protein
LDEAFSVTISPVRFAAILKPSATVTIADDDGYPPAPDPVTGEAAIDDNFDYAKAFEPTTYGPNGGPGIPGINPSNDLGAFRIDCQVFASMLRYDDPIVYPNQPGKSHLHQFISNTEANAASTYPSLRTKGGSSCDNIGETFAINRSSYWMPAMMATLGKAVLPSHVLVYYKRYPAGGPGCVGPMALGTCIDLPNGIRFVFGYNMKTQTGGPTGEGTRDYWSMSYGCWSNEAGTVPIPPAAQARFHTIADVVKAGCPAGAQLHIGLDAPDCWDGKNLDSADHRSHVVYAPDGSDKGLGYVCPADHPYLLPIISYQWFFPTDADFVAGNWHLASDEMLPNWKPGPDSPVPAGISLHMDYFEAWSPRAKKGWFRTCINGPMSCSGGDMGDGTMIRKANVPAEGWPVAPRYAAMPAMLPVDVNPTPPTQPVPPQPVWAKCADEGQMCNVMGPAQVRYGAGSSWTVKSVSGPILCDNPTFGGDPAVGTFKTCETDGMLH